MHSFRDSRIRRGFTLTELLIVLLILAVLFSCLGAHAPLERIWRLVVGWGYFLVRVLPLVEWSPAGFLTALVSGGLFLIGLHQAGRKWWPHGRWSANQPVWKLSWTYKLGLLVILLFASGTSLVGLVHQAIWLMSERSIIVNDSRGLVRSTQSRVHLKSLGRAEDSHEIERGSWGADFSSHEPGETDHSWATSLLPYLDESTIYSRVNLKEPWIAPSNRAAFTRRVGQFLQPRLESDLRGHIETPDGYAPIHYAMNSHLASLDNAKLAGFMHDSASATITFGEIHSAYPAWGAPFNFRDPTLGLNSAEGFGSPATGVVNFAFADGSARALSVNIDPQVLKALATPNGGETIHDF